MEAEQMEGKKKRFMAYDYKEIEAEGERLSLLLDAYESLGWELDERAGGKREEAKGKKVRLRRERKIINKMELTRLQRNMEACVASIDELERSVTSGATLYAVLLGLVGDGFSGDGHLCGGRPGASYPVVRDSGHSGICRMDLLPLFVYKWIRRKRRERTMPLIEEKYDEIYAICEKGQKLLY